MVAVAGLVAALAVGAAAAFGPVVRFKARQAAHARGLDLSIGAVGASWFGVALSKVVLRPEGVGTAQAELDEVRVDLDSTLSPVRVRASGGRVLLTGPTALDDVLAWRARRAPRAGGAGRATPVVVEGVDVSWAPGVEGEGLDVRSDDDGLHVAARHLRMTQGDLSFDLRDGSADLDATRKLARAHAGAIDLAWALQDPPPRAEAGAPLAAPPIVQRRGPVEPYRPLFVLPDLHAARAKLDALGAGFAERVTAGAVIDADDLSLAVTRGSDRIAIGGKVQITRNERGVALAFSSRAATGTTPLELGLDAPLGAGDIVAQLSGGPVALSLLGVKDGEAGLSDVDRATVTGRGRVVLASASDALRFDGSVALRGLSVRDGRIALDTVRGLDVGVFARGTLFDRGVLVLDDARLDMGALHASIVGSAEQAADHLGVKLTFDVPTAGCESLRASVPPALVATLAGARFEGTFGGHGTLAFDTRALDDLVLRYDLDDRCRVARVPDELARQRFAHPFRYWALDKDRRPVELESGPGSERWVSLEDISPTVQVAVLTTEDGAFYRHKGFNHAAIRGSLIADLKAHGFVRGASTITMQLAKNLFLSREKTVARKLQEIVLADYLEQTFTKEELMELYLNVIEFGPDVYGIGAAADHYFGRDAAELDLSEGMFLATALPHPIDAHKAWQKGEVSAHWVGHLRALMKIAAKTSHITPKELEDGLAETPVFHLENTPRPPSRSPVRGPSPRRTTQDEAWDPDWVPAQ